MIVKFDDGCGGWVYIEAQRIEARYRANAFVNCDGCFPLKKVMDWKDNKPILSDFDCYNDQFYMGSTFVERLREGKVDYILTNLITICKPGDNPIIIAVAGRVYIMNDNGKTIDRD